MWALLAHGNHRQTTEVPVSLSDASAPLMTVISLSDAEPDDIERESVSVTQTIIQEPAAPAYVNLSPFSLNQSVHLPLDSAFVTSDFGFRDHPVNGKYAFHSGLDLAAAEGTPIFAMLDGTVTKAEHEAGYGNFVVIDHGENVQTLYAHCSVLHAQPGEKVTKGTVIAEVGQTGTATGPHLHVELRYNGQRFDPEYILGDSYS